MKIEVSKKAIRETGKKIICISYCQAQHILGGKTPLMYSRGVYGWSCDYYMIDEKNVIISTGYNPIGEYKNYEVVRKYDQIAEKIAIHNWEEYKVIVNNLLNQMIDEILKGGEK